VALRSIPSPCSMVRSISFLFNTHDLKEKKVFCLFSLLSKFYTIFLDWKDGDKWVWSYKCAFEGKNLSSIQVRHEDCGGKCVSTPGCTHFTWDNYLGGTCWLKQGAIARTDAVYLNSSEILCGITRDTKPIQYGKIYIICIQNS
jgi:hypothetical protein